MKYYLNSFAQGPYDDSPVNCEVIYRDEKNPKITGTYPSEPLSGEALGPDYDNAALCKALTEQLGVPVEPLPKPPEPEVKVEPSTDEAKDA